MSIYQLTKEIIELETKWDDLEEGSEEEARALLKSLDERFDALEPKVDAVTRWVKSLEAEEKAIGEEIKRLQARKKAAGNRADSLRGYLIYCLNVAGLQKLKTAIASLSVTKPRERVEADSSRCWEWSPEFFEEARKAGAVKEVYEINLTELKKIPGFEKQPGVTVTTGDEGLTIR